MDFSLNNKDKNRRKNDKIKTINLKATSNIF